MTRVICLIQNQPPLVYFANRLRESCDVALVVVEGGSSRRLIPRSPRALILRAWSAVEGRVRAARRRTAERATCQRSFGDDWRALHPSLPTMHVRDINAPSVVQRVREIAPDVLIDHGTSLVRDELLDAAPIALNVHWGLSPWYRGVRCTEWALLHWDPYRIGVTIHLLSKRIDGGDILAQERIEVEPTDTVHSINMRLTKLGTELAARAIAHLDSGEPPRFEPQDLGLGFVTSSRQWSPHLERHVRLIERDGLIGKMLEKPVRR